MTNEKELYKEGDSLSKQAVRLGVAHGQLRAIYEKTQKKSLPFLEAHIKMQVGRRHLPRVFGEALLAMITKHKENRNEILSVLRYMIMMYNYNKLSGKHECSETESVETDIGKIAELIRPKVESLGFKSVQVNNQNGTYMVIVNLERFPTGNPGLLAKELTILIKDLPELKGSFVRVRFKTGRR